MGAEAGAVPVLEGEESTVCFSIVNSENADSAYVAQGHPSIDQDDISTILYPPSESYSSDGTEEEFTSTYTCCLCHIPPSIAVAQVLILIKYKFKL